MKLLVITAFALLLSQNTFAAVMSCEVDTKTCSDGLVVERVFEKNCEFAPCPDKKTGKSEKAENADKDADNE
jgi:hypothetical protein